MTANALSSNKEWNLKVSAAPESEIIHQSISEFTSVFKNAIDVDNEFLSSYEELYYKDLENSRFFKNKHKNLQKIEPNEMQKDALRNIEKIRFEGNNKALLISATGTGKTYLSAFDVMRYNPKRFFIYCA